MLGALSGSTHRVLTAVTIVSATGMRHALSISEVTFRPMQPAEIERYVASGEPLGKAGAYGIQAGRPSSWSGSRAAIQVSWACPCLRRRRYFARPACSSEQRPPRPDKTRPSAGPPYTAGPPATRFTRYD